MGLLKTYWWKGLSWESNLHQQSQQPLSQVKPNDPALAAAQLAILKGFGDHPTIITRRKDNGTNG